MPRVLIAGFCAFPGPDRAGVQLAHLIRAYARHHTVDVLAVRRGDQAYVEKLSGARILRVPVPDGAIRERIDAFRRALRRQLEGADYDLIHVRDGWSGIPVLEMQGRLRHAVVFDAGRSPLAEPPVHDHETAALLERDELECTRRADLVLTATEPARMYMASLVPPERVRVVPLGVDVDAFDWDEPPAGPPRILYAGALTPGRGVRVLLRAMLDVAGQSDAQLALAGRATPEFFASLEAAVRDLGLHERVRLLGEVSHDDVPGLIASATVCVAPGASDLGAAPLAVYPTKLLEYMACQRAVVAPDRGTVSMLVRDEQHALLFEPGQPIDLARKILRLLEDADLRVRIARAGYELVRRAHTASGTRRELRRAYAWLQSVSPWRERFAAVLEEMPTGDMPALAAADPTGPGAWMARRAAPPANRPIAAFEGDVLDDLTESSHVDTGLNEGFGEVTKVEPPPLADEDRSSSGYQPLATAITSAPLDDWVVEDSRIREVAAVDGAAGERSSATPALTPVDTRFVAGELEVPAGRPVLDPARQDPPGRDLSGRDLPGRDPPGRDLPGRDLPGRDPPGRDPPLRDPIDAALDADGAFTAMAPRLGGAAGLPPDDATGQTRPRRALRPAPGTLPPPTPPPLIPVAPQPGPARPAGGGAAEGGPDAAGPAGAPGRRPAGGAGPGGGSQDGPGGGSPTVVVGPDIGVRVGSGDDTGP